MNFLHPAQTASSLILFHLIRPRYSPAQTVPALPPSPHRPLARGSSQPLSHPPKASVFLRFIHTAFPSGIHPRPSHPDHTHPRRTRSGILIQIHCPPRIIENPPIRFFCADICGDKYVFHEESTAPPAGFSPYSTDVRRAVGDNPQLRFSGTVLQYFLHKRRHVNLSLAVRIDRLKIQCRRIRDRDPNSLSASRMR